MDEQLKDFLQEFQMEVDLCRAKYSSTGKDTYLEVLQNGITKLQALIASYSREAELKGQIKAFRSVPQIDVDLEQWLWEQIDPLEAELKALGSENE